MSWYDWFRSVWDALVNKILTVTEFSNNVFYGEKFPIVAFPSAYVCPENILITPATFRESFHNPTFGVGIVVQNVDAKAGYLKGYELAGKVHDVLIADRTLGNLVQNLEVLSIEPNWRNLGRGPETFWFGVIVRLVRKM